MQSALFFWNVVGSINQKFSTYLAASWNAADCALGGAGCIATCAVGGCRLQCNLRPPGLQVAMQPAPAEVAGCNATCACFLPLWAPSNRKLRRRGLQVAMQPAPSGVAGCNATCAFGGCRLQCKLRPRGLQVAVQLAPGGAQVALQLAPLLGPFRARQIRKPQRKGMLVAVPLAHFLRRTLRHLAFFCSQSF